MGPNPGESDAREFRRKMKRPASPAKGEPSRDKAAIIYRRDLPHAQARPQPLPLPPGPPVVLEDAVEGQEVCCGEGVRAFLVARHLREMPGGWDALCEAFAATMRREGTYLHSRIAEACDGSTPTPEEIIFLDLETGGLGNVPVFLIGVMVWEADSLVVRQYFARNYAEERAIVSLFAESASDKRLLVSFNGKSFDWPFIRMRAAACGVEMAAALPHFDLLHESRRIWKGRLPNCRLQTLERHLCGRHREGDIPGQAIPDAYHAYVRTANAVQMLDVLKHNRLDLITMADLMVRAADAAPPT